MVLQPYAKLDWRPLTSAARAVEEGLSVRAVRQRLVSCRRRRVVGRGVGAQPAAPNARRFPVCSIVPAGRDAMPRLLAVAEQQRICTAGGRLVGDRGCSRCATGHPHSTISKVLSRHGLSRSPSPTARACQPLRVAVSRRSAAHGRRPLRPASASRATASPATARNDRLRARRLPGRLRLRARDRRRPQLGSAYAELLPDEKAPHRHRVFERALAFFAEHGINTVASHDRQRLQLCQRTARCANCSPRTRIRHLTTKPYRPRTNGKVERFHQTMGREWAYARVAYPRHRHLHPPPRRRPSQHPRSPTARLHPPPPSAG